MNRSRPVRRLAPTTPFAPFEKQDATQSLAGRFEQQVRLHGARVAVETKRESLAYDRLNGSANRLARALVGRGGRHELPVALLFKQGPGLITANLAVLKTGRPYVQIDYTLPRERAARVLENSQANIVVTDREHIALARALARDDVGVINIDDLNDGLAETNLEIAVSPDQVAYIHYTSGTTGKPKGVASSHRSELNNIRLKTNALHITPADRISLLRSNNVGATSDMLLGLLNGATLFPLELREAGLAGLAAWLIEEEITVFTCVASIFRHAVRALGSNQRFSRIRLVHVGGEPLYQSDVELYKNYFPDSCLLVNRLGISETKTATYFFIDKNSAIEEPTVPVGCPLECYEISICDEQGQAVGANCVGEIAVKSPYLAIGYWRRPDLTKEKFLDDPAGGDSRVYLSGDLGYLRPDGCLVHVGRKDFQTKIRGHRVELAEVENALLDIEGIRQAAVAAQDEANGNTQLVAYIARDDSQSLTVSSLRAALEEKLPSYMIPATFMFMQHLPLTSSGKIDRRALPASRRGRDELANRFVAPRSALETVLAQLWSEVLQLGEIGVDDNFAELGGDSLLASQIASRLNDLFSLSQPIKTLFGTSTVAALAAFVSAQERSPGEAERIAVAVLKVAEMSTEEVAKALADTGQRHDG
ncbi:MAG TPA: non-ribosomal peptide synthetase [Candidatus Binatia bacterium]|nr:non-ribosomal peptide synthetase [Candidatus Binatia bacterium]